MGSVGCIGLIKAIVSAGSGLCYIVISIHSK